MNPDCGVTKVEVSLPYTRCVMLCEPRSCTSSVGVFMLAGCAKEKIANHSCLMLSKFQSRGGKGRPIEMWGSSPPSVSGSAPRAGCARRERPRGATTRLPWLACRLACERVVARTRPEQPTPGSGALATRPQRLPGPSQGGQGRAPPCGAHEIAHLVGGAHRCKEEPRSIVALGAMTSQPRISPPHQPLCPPSRLSSRLHDPFLSALGIGSWRALARLASRRNAVIPHCASVGRELPWVQVCGCDRLGLVGCCPPRVCVNIVRRRGVRALSPRSRCPA